MAEARQSSEWGHTAAMLAQIANVGNYLFAKKPRAYSPREFNPTVQAVRLKHSVAHKMAMMKFMWTKAK